MRKALHSQQYKHFLNEFQSLRKRAKLSQVELGELLGVSQDVISRCESGRRRVDVMELHRWTEACGTTLLNFIRRLNARLARHAKLESLKEIE